MAAEAMKLAAPDTVHAAPDRQSRRREATTSFGSFSRFSVFPFFALGRIDLAGGEASARRAGSGRA